MIRAREEIMKLYDSGVYLVNGTELVADDAQAAAAIKEQDGQRGGKSRGGAGNDRIRHFKGSQCIRQYGQAADQV